MIRGAATRLRLQLGVLCLFAPLVCTPGPAVAQNSCDAPAGSVPREITREFPNGARWRLCVRNDEAAGLVIHNARYSGPRLASERIVDEASLARVLFLPETGPAKELIGAAPNSGLGGANLLELQFAECPDGNIERVGGRETLCVTSGPRGYLYKSYGIARTGYQLELTSVSEALGYTVLVRWRFFDNGTIEPAAAWTGTSPASAPSRAATLLFGWRVDLDLGDSGTDDQVEQFDVLPTSGGAKKILTRTVLHQEASLNTLADHKRSWRLIDETLNADAHPRSFQIEFHETAHAFPKQHSLSAGAAPVAWTSASPCERYLAHNRAILGCGEDGLLGFLETPAQPLVDPVAWIQVPARHVPRLEDVPAISARWHTFLIKPRDWTARNPIHPSAALEAPETGAQR